MTTIPTVNARWLDGSIQKMENCQIVGDIRWQVVQRSGCMWRDVNVMSMIGGDFNTLKPTETFDSAPQDVFVNIKGSNDSLTTREELQEEWADCIEMHARYGDVEGVERAAEKMREGEFLVRPTVRDILSKQCFPHAKAKERNLNTITVFAKALGPQILDVRDPHNNDSALIHIAAWERDVTMIKVLLDANANIDITDDSRCTPLHFAVFQSQNACKCGDEECKDNLHSCRVLVKAKASVNAKNNCGNTALLSAIDTGVSELVRMLLDSGADVNIQNNLGSTPLHKTCERRDSKITSMLVLDGADPTIEDVMGYVPQIPKLVPRKVSRVKSFYRGMKNWISSRASGSQSCQAVATEDEEYEGDWLSLLSHRRDPQPDAGESDNVVNNMEGVRND